MVSIEANQNIDILAVGITYALKSNEPINRSFKYVLKKNQLKGK